MTGPVRCSSSRSTATRAYEPYLDASWGVKNYWLPALCSHELAKGEVKGVTIAGVPILLRRAKGKVHALHDQVPAPQRHHVGAAQMRH